MASTRCHFKILINQQNASFIFDEQDSVLSDAIVQVKKKKKKRKNIQSDLCGWTPKNSGIIMKILKMICCLTDVFPSPYPFSATFCLLACPFQQFQEDDLLITGFICLSSSREIIPKCEGSSNIIFATRYPAIDHV